MQRLRILPARSVSSFVHSKRAHTDQRRNKCRRNQVLLDKRRLRPEDVNVMVTRNSEAKKILGWLPTITFEEGIQRTVKWYKENGQTWGYEKQRRKWRY